MRGIVFRDDKKPGCFFIQPMHDAGALDTADAGKFIAAIGKQRIDERAVMIAGAGMHDHAGRLIDDDDVLVFVNNFQINLLRLRYGLDRRRHGDFKNITWFHFIRAVIKFLAVQQQVTALDQLLEAGARIIWRMGCQHLVEAQALVAVGCFDGKGFHDIAYRIIKGTMPMRGLKTLVATMTVLLALGMGLLVYGLVTKTSTKITAKQPVTAAPSELQLPNLSHVEHISAWKDGIALYVATPDGDYIYFVDPTSGVSPARIKIKRTTDAFPGAQ